jgi:hypothetical protein
LVKDPARKNHTVVVGGKYGYLLEGEDNNMFTWFKNLFGGNSKNDTTISVPYTWEENSTPADPLKLDGTDSAVSQPAVQEVTDTVDAQPADCGCADVPAVATTDTTQVVAGIVGETAAEVTAKVSTAGYRPWADDYADQSVMPSGPSPTADVAETPAKATKTKVKTVKAPRKTATKKAAKTINGVATIRAPRTPRKKK